jgi:hypothetical protein
MGNGRDHRTAILALAAGLALGCGSAAQQEEYREAAAIAGIAAAAAVVQTARAQAPDAKSQVNSPGACCAICRTCEFPCGDACVLYGTVCTDPPGCACSDASAEGRDQPRESSPPLGCPTGPAVILPVR